MLCPLAPPCPTVGAYCSYTGNSRTKSVLEPRLPCHAVCLTSVTPPLMTRLIQGHCGAHMLESRAAEVSQRNGVWQGLSTSFHAPNTQLPPYSAVESGTFKWKRAADISFTQLGCPVLSAATCSLWHWADCVKESPVRTELTTPGVLWQWEVDLF